MKSGKSSKSVNSHVTYRKKEVENVPSGHKRYGCVEARRNNDCKMKATVKLDVVEQAVVTFCQDQVNLKRIILGGGNSEKLKSKESQLRLKLEEVHNQIDRLTDALSKAGGINPVSVITKISDLEGEIKSIRFEIDENRTKQSKIANSCRDEVSDKWLTITDNLAALDNEARLVLRSLVRDTFKSITIRTDVKENQTLIGLNALIAEELMVERSSSYFDLTMEFHNGSKRLLRLNRNNGKLFKGFDI